MLDNEPRKKKKREKKEKKIKYKSDPRTQQEVKLNHLDQEQLDSSLRLLCSFNFIMTT